jgi:hypothetical protein
MPVGRAWARTSLRDRTPASRPAVFLHGGNFGLAVIRGQLGS